MEDLPYDTIVVIIAFWMVLVSVIVTVICRIRLRHTDDDTLDEITIESAVQSPPPPGRIIHIFYIGNNDSSSTGDALGEDDIVSKVLTIVDDNPPPYDELLERSWNSTSIHNAVALDGSGLGSCRGTVQLPN